MTYSANVRKLAVRWGPVLGVVSHSMLRSPLFLVGFNKSGKSTLVHGLAQQPGIAIFPGEGNDVLWFRGYYPWEALDVDVPPMWHDPDAFVRAVVAARPDGFLDTRAQLGLYQALRAPAGTIVNDSGMLAALLPDIVTAFPDARVVHLVRDGRVVSHISAQKTMERIERNPDRYRAAGSPKEYAAVLDSQAAYWCWTLDRVASMEVALPGSVLEVRYEDWCEDPDGTLRRVVAFAGRERTFRRPAWDAPIMNQNPAVLSRLSPAHLRRIETIQSHHLTRFGYALRSGATC